MKTTADHAVNAARALPLVLSSLRSAESTDDRGQLSQNVFDEIDRGSLELVAVVLAHLVAKEMARAHGPKKAACKLEKSIAGLLDVAAPPAPSGGAAP